MNNFDELNAKDVDFQSNGQKTDITAKENKKSDMNVLFIIIGVVAVIFVTIFGLAAYAIYHTVSENVMMTSDDETNMTTNEIMIQTREEKDRQIRNSSLNLKTALETYYAVNEFYPPDNHVGYLWSGNRVVLDRAPSLPEECGSFNNPGDECGVTYTSTNENQGYLINITYLGDKTEVMKGGVELE